MSQLVQCPNPACSKKFNLTGKIPAVFTCTQCGQAMDLSAFAPAPVPAAAPSRRSAGPSRSEPRPAARGARSRRDEEDEGGRTRFRPKPSSNAPMIWGSVGAVAIAAGLFVFLSDDDKPAPTPTAASGASGAPAPDPGATLDGMPVPLPGGPVAGVPMPSSGTPPGSGAAPAAGPTAGPAPGSGTPVKPGPEPARPSTGSTAIKTWPFPDDVTAEERERIERAMDTALNDVGASMREAQDTLIGLKRKSVWRLVSEFKHIQDTDTFESRKGLIRAMIVDRVLRRIDGFMERKTAYKEHINPESSPDYASGVAKRWNAWLDSGMWKTELTPWDPRVDESDEPREKPAPGGGR